MRFPPFRKEGDEIIHSKVTMGMGVRVEMLGVLKLQVAGGVEALSFESSQSWSRDRRVHETDTG